VPQYVWFVRQASAVSASVSILVLATGMLSPLLRPGIQPETLEAVIHDHAPSMLAATVLLMLLLQLRQRRVAIINRDIWGSTTRARLATVIKFAVLMAVLRIVTLVLVDA
jgi:hypothetical protein